MKKKYIAPEHTIYNITTCQIIAQSPTYPVNTGIGTNPDKGGKEEVESDAAMRRQSDWSNYEGY